MVMGATDQILPEDLPAEIFEVVALAPDSSPKYQNVVKEQKKQLVQKAMQQCGGNYIEAAKVLGLHPNSLLRLIRRPGAESSRVRSAMRKAAFLGRLLLLDGILLSARAILVFTPRTATQYADRLLRLSWSSWLSPFSVFKACCLLSLHV